MELYKGFHSIEQIEVDIKGNTRTIERVGIKNAVAAVVTDAEGKIGLVKQYRPCIGEVLYEIPAGLVDKEGKTNTEILIEELEEECEIDRNNIIHLSLEPLHKYYMICGSSNAEISLHRVKLDSVEHSKTVSDKDVESVKWLTITELENLISNGEIKDPKTLLAYYLIRLEGLG